MAPCERVIPTCNTVKMEAQPGTIIITSLLQSTAGRRTPPIQGGFARSHHARQAGWWPQCMFLDNVIFTRGAAAHLPDKPLITFYDTHGRKGGDGILLCRHHTASTIICLNLLHHRSNDFMFFSFIVVRVPTHNLDRKHIRRHTYIHQPIQFTW